MNISAMRSTIINSLMSSVWSLQYAAVTANKSGNKKFPTFPPESTNNGPYLIIAPHADDELVGCYQLIIEEHRSSIHIFYCGLTGSNEDPENKKTRDAEISSFCENKSVNLITAEGDLQNSLLRTIDRVAPSVILLPPLIDWHTEHRLTHLLVHNALKESPVKPEIALYQVSVPHEKKQITHSIPITKDQQNQKWRDFSHFYRSQKNMPIKLFRCHERISGSYSGVYAAEAFMLIRFKDWEKSLAFIQEEKNAELLNNLYRPSFSITAIHRGKEISLIRDNLIMSCRKDSAL